MADKNNVEEERHNIFCAYVRKKREYEALVEALQGGDTFEELVAKLRRWAERARKEGHNKMAAWLSSIADTLDTEASEKGKVIFVDPANGDDANDGSSPDKAKRTVCGGAI